MRIHRFKKAVVRFLCVFGLALAFAGCAVPPSTPVDYGRNEGNADLTALKQEVQELSAEIDKNRDNLLLLEARLRDHQQVIDSMVAKKVTQTTPKGFTRVMGYESAGTEASPTAVYLEAFGEYAAGRYESAAAAFKSFLEKFPGNNYAGNATFWLGECHFSLKHYDLAVDEFNRVVNLYPRSEKAPEALVKAAQAYRELQQPDRAEETLRFLLDNYPDSPAARAQPE